MNQQVLTTKMHRKVNLWYSYLLIYIKLKGVKIDFMNLGYANPCFNPNFTLRESDFLRHRYRQVALYLKLFGELKSTIKNALEIGSGYGGGCYLLKEYYKINEVIGIDANSFSINYASKKFKNKYSGLDFKKFTSDNFILLNMKFDMIFSLEASLHFRCLDTFFENVYHSLNDNGEFLYGDLFHKDDLKSISNLLINKGFNIEKEEDISDEVLKSIDMQDSTTGLFKFFEAIILDCSGSNFNHGSILYRKLERREIKYVIFRLSKKPIN